MDQKLLGLSGQCRSVAALLLGGTLAIGVLFASGDPVVNLCHADNETGPANKTNLTSAIAQGGHISFDCGPRATIIMTRSHDINFADTVVDGGDADRVVLDGQNKPLTMFRMTRPNISLRLANITITRAAHPPELSIGDHVPGSVVELIGRDNSLIIQSAELNSCSYPIYVLDGQLQIRNTRFENNSGVAIHNSGIGDITDSSFISNDTALTISGFADVSFPTTLTGHVEFDSNRQHAIYVSPGGRLIATGASFNSNKGVSGAAIGINGLAQEVTLRKVTFTDNEAQVNGGAIAIERFLLHVVRPHGPPVRVTLNNASFRRNKSLQSAGGAIYADLFDGGTLFISGGRFSGNGAGTDGGALFVRPGGSLALKNSLFKANTAPRASALMLVRTGVGDRLTNTLIVANKANQGGGAVVANAVDFFNVTIADNEGGGIAEGAGSRDMRDVVNGAPVIRIHNTIAADNRPSNCAGRLTIHGNGANLQSPSQTPCSGFELTAVAMLDTYFAPLPASPALGHGILSDCLQSPVSGHDILAQKRGVGGYCSIGAFEAAPMLKAEDLVSSRPPSNGHPNGRRPGN